MKARTIVELDQSDLVEAISRYIQDEGGQTVDSKSIADELTGLDLHGLTLDSNPATEGTSTEKSEPPKKRKRRTRAEIEADEKAEREARESAKEEPPEEEAETAEPEADVAEAEVNLEEDTPEEVKEEVNETEATKPVASARSLFN